MFKGEGCLLQHFFFFFKVHNDNIRAVCTILNGSVLRAAFPYWNDWLLFQLALFIFLYLC